MHPSAIVDESNRRPLIGAALLLCAAACSMSLTACHESAQAAEESSATVDPLAPKVTQDTVTLPSGSPQVSSLVLESAKPADRASLHVTGRLAWDEESTVRVFPSVAGRVSQIQAQLGQAITKGQTLTSLASPDFGQAEAESSKAAADLKLAERTLNRLQELLAHGAAAKKDVEQAEDDFETKKIEKQRAEARLKLYGVTDNAIDGMFPMIAPIGGVVVEKNINPGQEVRPDQMLASDPRYVLPLFVISDPKKLSVVLDVTELETSQLTQGESFKVTTQAYPGKVFTGKLEVIGGSIDPVTRTVKARGIVDNSDGLLKAEMFVSIDLETKVNQSPATTGTNAKAPATALVDLPSKAVFLKSNKHFVFVEESPGMYQRKPVEVESENAGRVLASGPVAAGQRVVAEGGLLLDALTEGESE